MKKIFYITLLLVFSNTLLTAQKNQFGNHLITNYSQDDYGAASQNWSVVQDKRGVVYVGNEGVVLEYDGENWRKIPNNNGSYVRSLASDEEGTIYVGSSNEFGLLKPNKKGEMVYKELSADIDSSFKDVWNIYVADEVVYFSTASNLIFKYENDSLQKISYDSKLHFLDFYANGTLYMGDYGRGLLELNDQDRPVMAEGGGFYEKKDIFSILPFRENTLFVTVSGEGIYIYNENSGESRPLNTLGGPFKELNDYLKKVRVYNGTLLRNGDYAFGSLDDGVIIVDGETGEIKYHYTDKNGLIDPTVINVYESHTKNIWLALNKGIAKISYGAPFTYFGKKDGLQGIAFDAIRFGDHFYVGTSSGVYKQGFDERGMPYFEKLPLIQNQVRSLVDYKHPGTDDKLLIAGTHKGTYDITNAKDIAKLRSDDRYNKTNIIKPSRFDRNKILVGHYNGLGWFEYTNGKWINHEELRDSVKGNVLDVVELNDSVVWASTILKGIYRITNLKRVKHFDISDGLPEMEKNRVARINGRLAVTTQNGLYRFDQERQHFVKDSVFGVNYLNGPIVNFFNLDPDSYLLVYLTPDQSEKVNLLNTAGDSLHIIEKPFLRIKGEEYLNAYRERENGIWLTTYNGVFHYDQTQLHPDKQTFQTLIRKVSLGKDSVLFQGTNYEDTTDFDIALEQPSTLKHQIQYKYNDLAFFYSAACFEREDRIEYSYKLDGYDDNWSNWATKADKGYTNLNEGEYTFKVKARNIYGEVGEIASYSFSVLPPWYRTVWAYIGYVIAAIGLIVLIVKWYTRRLKKEKIRLEQTVQERTREVVAQKEQIEHQRDEIVKKNRDITDSIEYASKIQKAVLPDPEFTENILPEHFIFYRPRDIVSGDFYWINRKDNLLVIIAADCTGHGVPGAFMSMLGVSLLNEIVNKHDVAKANEILTELRAEVKRTLNQKGEEGEAKDGMDIALTLVDLEKRQLQYAGAYNPLFLFREGEFIQYKADRMPIGIYIKEKPEFTNHIIELKPGDTFYIFSDGFQDQFGGSDGSKFKVKRLKNVLSEIQDKPMKEQKKMLDQTFDDWKGEYEQLDDVILIGVRINE